MKVAQNHLLMQIRDEDLPSHNQFDDMSNQGISELQNLSPTDFGKHSSMTKELPKPKRTLSDIQGNQQIQARFFKSKIDFAKTNLGDSKLPSSDGLSRQSEK